MIYSLRGKLILKELGFAVIECDGVGYGFRTSYNTLSKLGEIGSEVMAYTHLSVREDSVELFGFADMKELNCFRMLVSVSGVGPKAAVSILSDMSPEQFALTVASGDSKSITRTKGIGTKTAQRIVLELKDKISADSFGTSEMSGTSGLSAVSASGTSSVGEALEALMVLGYSQSEAAPVLRKLDPALDTQELIKAALKALS
ncbi:MAG: Holliday junction branch migration protein RuvA [Ruminococcus sp.]|nr:Holliday junction branch migration protein RuvA [Ruminococcus sp.]MDE6784548.1 Holliday junction branch migration protein RuvA [Ruminococcus sp.]